MQLKTLAYVIKYDSLLIKLKKIKALWAFNNFVITEIINPNVRHTP